jgi:selenocysteine lyase/cysteine desulfurase
LEAGTPNLPGILGLGAALTELKLWDLTELLERAQALRSQLISGLAEMSSVKTMSPISGGSAVSFQVDVDMGALAHELWKRGEVAVRAGLHCSPMAHQALGSYPNGAIRASVSPISTNGEEIDKFLDLLKKMI